MDGIHYHFTEIEDMEKAVNNGEFLEYAKVHGNYYGTSKKAVEEVKFELYNYILLKNCIYFFLFFYP